jgi:acyl-CoA reductase-like NAD-dependent aldehyde dehydrogenase
MQTQLFINGRFVAAEDGATLPVLNPHDNSVIADVAMAGKADIDKAVAAAQKVFPKWARMAAMERGRLLLKLADAIEANADELARLESLDTGHPLRDTRNLDVPRTAATFRYFGGMADKLEGTVIPVEAGFLNYMLREPVGVVGQVVPWNFPLMFTSWKMAPALAAGNCVVMKPAELTPLTTLRIVELMAEVGFPDGVVNIVPGLGHIAGQYLAEHEDIAKIAFTGSTATGRRVVQASAGNLKKVQLELGGKGANIVFADANIDAAVNGSAFAIFHNQGQACIAGSPRNSPKSSPGWRRRSVSATRSIRRRSWARSRRCSTVTASCPMWKWRCPKEAGSSSAARRRPTRCWQRAATSSRPSCRQGRATASARKRCSAPSSR